MTETWCLRLEHETRDITHYTHDYTFHCGRGHPRPLPVPRSSMWQQLPVSVSSKSANDYSQTRASRGRLLPPLHRGSAAPDVPEPDVREDGVEIRWCRARAPQAGQRIKGLQLCECVMKPRPTSLLPPRLNEDIPAVLAARDSGAVASDPPQSAPDRGGLEEVRLV